MIVQMPTQSRRGSETFIACDVQKRRMGVVHLPLPQYRSGMLNSNTVNSKFHLIQNFFEYLAKFLSFHV